MSSFQHLLMSIKERNCNAGTQSFNARRLDATRQQESNEVDLFDYMLKFASNTASSDAEFADESNESNAEDEAILQILGSMQEPSKELFTPFEERLTHRVVAKVLLGAEDVHCASNFLKWIVDTGYYVPQIFTYNCLIYAFVKKEKIQEAYQMYRKLSLAPNCFTYGILIGAFSATGDIPESVKLFDEMRHMGHDAMVVCCNFFIYGLCKAGKVSEAVTEYRKMQEICTPNVITYNILLNAWVKENNVQMALEMYKEMLRAYCRPNQFTYRTLIPRLCKAKRAEEAFELLKEMIEKGCIPDQTAYASFLRYPEKALLLLDEKMMKPDMMTYGTLMNGLCEMGKVEYAVEMLRRIKGKGKVEGEGSEVMLYGIVVKGLCKARKAGEALDILKEMVEDGYTVEADACNALVCGLVRAGMLDEAHVAVKEMMTIDCEVDEFTFNTFSSALCKAGRLDEASNVFKEMMRFHCCPNTVTYAAWVLEMCRDENRVDEAYDGFMEMLIGSKFQPNIDVYVPLLHGVSKKGNIRRVDSLVKDMIRRGFSPTFYARRAIMDGVCEFIEKKGCEWEWVAENILWEIPSCDVYSSIVEGILKAGRVSEAYDLVVEMREKKGMVLNNFRYNTLVKSLCDVGKVVESAEVLYDAIEKRGMKMDGVAYHAVMDGMCHAGMVMDAYHHFERMVRMDVQPKYGSYTWLVDRLCTEGKVNEAMVVVKAMENLGRSPGIFSYNALVDALYKAGRIDEATYDVFEHMKCAANEYTYNKLIIGLCEAAAGRYGGSRYCTEAGDGGRYVKEGDGSGSRYVEEVGGRYVKAFEVYKEAVQREFRVYPIAYDRLVEGLCEIGMVDEAYEIYVEMIERGYNPKYATYSNLIMRLCESRRRRVDEAYSVVKDMVRFGRFPKIDAFNAVVEGYYELRRYEDASRAFDEMRKHFRMSNAAVRAWAST